MRRLKIPSAQHLARIWRPSPEAVKEELIKLAKGGPPFSYDLLPTLVRDMLILGVPLSQVTQAVSTRIPLEIARRNYLEILPLLAKYISKVRPTFIHAVGPRRYPIGKGLFVPMKFPFIYGADGAEHLPWLSFWRSMPLSRQQLALFASVVVDTVAQDADLDTASLPIISTAAPSAGEQRELQIVDARQASTLAESEKSEMLAIFVEGFSLAQKEMAHGASDSTRRDKRREDSDGDEIGPGLFD